MLREGSKSTQLLHPDLIYGSTLGRMGNGDRMRMATIKGQSKAVSAGERNEDDDNDFRDFDVI